MNSIENKIGENLKKLRKLLDITQVDFAKSIKITSSYVSAIEKGIAKNVSDQIYNSIELIYGVNRNLLEKGSLGDIEEAIKIWLNYSATDQKYLNVAQSKNEYDKHGGWIPQSKESDWGCIPKVVEIIGSDTIYSKALLQNIEAFYEAVMTKKDQRKDERRKQVGNYEGKDRRVGEDRRKKAPRE